MKEILKIVLGLSIISLLVGLTLIIINGEKPFNYEYVGGINNDIIVVSDGEKYGYFDVKDNKLKVKLKYNLPRIIKESNLDYLESLDYQYGYIKTTQDDKYGLNDIDDNIVIEPKYSSIKLYGKNLILVCDNNYYFINSKEEKISDKSYSFIEPINNKIFLAENEDRYEIITDKMLSLFKTPYEHINYYGKDDEYIFELVNGESYNYYLYSEGKLSKLPFETKINICNYSENTITYYKESRKFYNFDVLKLKETFIGEYIEIGKYVDNLAYAINEGRKLGYIDKEGKVVIPIKYNSNIVNSFNSYDLTIVRENDKSKVINKIDNVLLEENAEIKILNDKLFIVGNQNFNLIDINHNIITNKEYNSINKIDESDKYLLTSCIDNQEQLYGLIDYKGSEIKPCEYKEIKVYEKYIVLKEKTGKYIIEKTE